MLHRLFWAALSIVVVASGCLTRPVVNDHPATKTSFIGAVSQQNIDKVDLLFAIDNSSSMGDKQGLLALAVPVLVNRLINPNCVSTLTCAQASDCAAFGASAQCDIYGNGGAGQCYVAGDNGGPSQCSSIPNSKPEFLPVHDLHVAIVSSSLGSGGGDVCTADAPPLQWHVDDAGHLLNRTVTSPSPLTEGSVSNAQPVDKSGGSFLAWLPASYPQNAGKPQPNVTPYSDPKAFINDFTSLITGVQQHGCGLEAQLESWYRFLVQPDPWQSIVTDNSNPPRTSYQGIDPLVLKERHDFLRPDSLVAIIQLTDEEDSWSDPLWGGDATKGGFGWVARSQQHIPGAPCQGPSCDGAGPLGTSACVNPNDPACTSCMFSGTNDPACKTCPAGLASCNQSGNGPGWWEQPTMSTPIAAADGINNRYSRQIMKQRYGFDNQHNYHRYVEGLTSAKVPDRFNESHDSASYNPNRNCTNPLFAASLPDGSDTTALCNLPPGGRTAELVYYAVIGGVPNELLEDAKGNFKLDLSAADWKKILGNDPDHYDFSGIDPHMVQSVVPRAGLEAPSASYTDGTDPIHGREWNTLSSLAGSDLQYACTFPLPSKDCTLAVNQGACDCTGNAATDPGGPPLCDPQARTHQIFGKAYPQSRYQLVAKALGQQAVVASICAKNTTGDQSAPSFGYNGAMQAIASRLRSRLTGQCLPQQLVPGSDGTVPCLVLVEYPSQTNQAAGCTDPGMSQPTADVLQRFTASWSDAGGAPLPVVCVYQQLQQTAYTGASCVGQSSPGWCYVSGASNTSNGCSQAIEFGASGPPSGTVVSLECIEQRSSADGG